MCTLKHSLLHIQVIRHFSSRNLITTAKPTTSPAITGEALRDSVISSQWQFIKQFIPGPRSRIHSKPQPQLSRH
nr:pentatricopeptide repeat-containing protein At2g15630, mitochondrial [Ipomoea batatas]